MVRRRSVLVLGLGNPLRGDDAVGPRVVEELSRRDLPEGVTVLDGGTGGLDLLRILERWERAVIVDAADVGREPGRFVRFAPDRARLTPTTGYRFSLHHAGLGEALRLADALDLPLPEMVIFGMQPAEIGWSDGLSPTVETALPALIDAVLREIAGICPKEKIMPKILVIEDDPDMVAALRMPLEAHDYEIFAASTGKEGLRKVQEIEPDLIILDVMMETTTAGFQVSLQLRSPDPDSEYAEYRDIPILILTAIHDTTSLRFGPDEAYLPVDDFVDKPIDPDELLEKVEKLIAKSR